MRIINVKIEVGNPGSFRQAECTDIVEGAVMFLVGDDNILHYKEIEEVLRPDDLYKAFVATDGCRYGLEDLYVLNVMQ